MEKAARTQTSENEKSTMHGTSAKRVSTWALALAIFAAGLILGYGDAVAKTKGCADGEVTKWSEVTHSWECAGDNAATNCPAGYVLGGAGDGCVALPDTSILQTQIDDLIFELTTNTVFVTSQVFSGNLGRIWGADQKCNEAAAAAGLFGNYKAWLTDNLSAPVSDFVRSGRPYYLTDGVTKVADDWVDLTDDTLQAPIDLDEHGSTPSGIMYVWSAANSLGEGSPFYNHCLSWQYEGANGVGDYGSLTSDDYLWSGCVGCEQTCDSLARLYCFEQ